jgi:hypothetical protein
MNNLSLLLSSNFEEFKKTIKKSNLSQEEYYSLLKDSVYFGDTNAVEFILKKIDINYMKDDSVLLSSVLNKNIEMSKYLLKKGADVTNSIFSNSDDIGLLKDFLQYSNKINKKNTFFLDYATLLNNNDKVKFLLKEKFSFDSSSIDNAIKHNNKEIFESLIQNSAENISPSSFLKLEIAKHKMLLDLLFHEDRIDAKKMLRHSILKEDKDMLKYFIEEKKVDVEKDLIDSIEKFDLKEFIQALLEKEKNKNSNSSSVQRKRLNR